MKTGPDISSNWNAPSPFKCPTKAYWVKVENKGCSPPTLRLSQCEHTLVEKSGSTKRVFKKKGPRITTGQV